MIKQLIKDIVYESISLSKALTISKLIAAKIKNQIFKDWLIKELEGYKFDDAQIPEYRKIWSPITLNAEFPYGRTQAVPVILNDDFTSDDSDYINRHQVTEPIAIVENHVNSMQKAKGYISLLPKQVEVLADLYLEDVQRHNGVIRSGVREVGRTQYQNILEMTKQKLLDTLYRQEDFSCCHHLLLSYCQKCRLFLRD